MRRRLAIAALCAAVLVAPLWAQMHSSARGSASRGWSGISSRGSAGVRSGFGSGPRFGVGFNGGFHQPRVFRSRPPVFGIRQPYFSPRRFRRQFFFAVGGPSYYGYYGAPAYYGSPVYYGDYSYATQDYYPAYDAYGAQTDAAQQQEIDRLEDEVARLREQRELPHAAPPRPQAESRPEPSTPTLLVFRDKHTQEVGNYAVVGGTLWIFNEQRATKLPLSWLDIDATTKANEDRGVDFQIPKSPR